MNMSCLRFIYLFLLVLALGAGCDDGEKRIADNGDTDDAETPSDGDGTGNTVCPPGDTIVETHGQLQVDGAYMKNSCGENVQLRGVSSMWLNWESKPYAESHEAMKWMIDNWNIQIFRAAMGIEPSGAYLSNPSKAKQQVRTIVNNAIDLGIYVIIDWHSHNASNPDQQAEAVAFFTEMAAEFGAYPNVLYETWNEPERQDWETVIKPYHETLVQVIRSADPDNIIILGTPSWCQLPSVAVNSPVAGDHLVYAVHFYSCSHGQEIRNGVLQANFHGVPIFISEWGATDADGGVSDKTVCSADADNWLELADDTGASWVAWKLEGCADTSCLFRSGTATDGPFGDALQGHGEYVVSKLLE